MVLSGGDRPMALSYLALCPQLVKALIRSKWQTMPVTGKRVFKMPSGFRVLATAAVPPRYAGGAKTLVSLLPQQFSTAQSIYNTL